MKFQGSYRIYDYSFKEDEGRGWEGLNMFKIRGQRFNRASSMSGNIIIWCASNSQAKFNGSPVTYSMCQPPSQFRN